MSKLTFTGQTFLVGYSISRHLMGGRTHQLYDAEQDALMDFLDGLGLDDGGRNRWVVTTPNTDGLPGVCAVTGRESESLERVALISWAEAES